MFPPFPFLPYPPKTKLFIIVEKLPPPPPQVNLIFNDTQKSVQSWKYIFLTSYNAKKELRTFTEVTLYVRRTKKVHTFLN